MRVFRELVVIAMCIGAVGTMQAHAQTETWVVENPVEDLPVRVHRDRATVITFTGTISSVGPPANWKVHLDWRKNASAIVLSAQRDARPEELVGTVVVVAGNYTINVIVEPATSRHDASGAIAVMHRDERARFEAEVRATAEHIAAEKTAELVRQHAAELEAERARHRDEIKRLKRQGKAASQREAEQARKIAELTAKNVDLTAQITELTAQITKQTARGDHLAAQLKEASATKQRPYGLPGLIEKTRQDDIIRPRKVMTLQDLAPPGDDIAIRGRYLFNQEKGWHIELDIENRGDEPVAVDELHAFDEATRRDLTGRVSVITDQEGDGPVVLKPHEPVTAIVELLSFESVGKTISVMLSQTGNIKRATWRNGIPVVDLTPSPHENEGKMTVSLVGAFGAMWIPNPESLMGELEATDIRGIGARFTYGLTRRLNMEIEAMGASTGTVTFAEGSRSATLGRVQGGIMARFGDGTWRPLVRGLVGLQGASYKGGVGDGFEFALSWSVGAGLDFKAGPFVLGLGVSGGQLISDPTRYFEGGISLGYGWKPGKGDD